MTSLKLRYVFDKKTLTISIISDIEKIIKPGISYLKIPVAESELKFEISYTEKISTGATNTVFRDSEPLKTKIVLPVLKEYTVKNLRGVIKSYLLNFGMNSQFEVKTIFKTADGTTQDLTIAWISDDADIDIIL